MKCWTVYVKTACIPFCTTSICMSGSLRSCILSTIQSPRIPFNLYPTSVKCPASILFPEPLNSSTIIAAIWRTSEFSPSTIPLISANEYASALVKKVCASRSSCARASSNGDLPRVGFVHGQEHQRRHVALARALHSSSGGRDSLIERVQALESVSFCPLTTLPHGYLASGMERGTVDPACRQVVFLPSGPCVLFLCSQVQIARFFQRDLSMEYRVWNHSWQFLVLVKRMLRFRIQDYSSVHL